jgi:DNA repair protein RadC
VLGQTIVAHTQPSGDPEPSPEDRSGTQRLLEAGTLQGIEVRDHVIVTHEGFVSMKERQMV